MTEDDGSHVRDDTGIVGLLMRKVFGEDSVVGMDDTRGAGTGGVRERDGETPGVDCGGLDRDVVRVWVLGALRGTRNNSAPGPDGIGYRLIKAVRDMRLGRELVEEVVDSLVEGEIPKGWGQIRAVFIPKPGRDLRKPGNWRPLNLINCVRKLGEKVVADRLQECGDALFHHLQFGSVKGRSATDVLYKAVRTPRKVLDGGGSVGWGFWDVKGGFQNVVGA